MIKRIVVGLLLVTSLAGATYKDWSAPYCRSYYRKSTTWTEYQNWYSHCLWAKAPEDAGYGVDTFTVTKTQTASATGTGAVSTGTTTGTVTKTISITATGTATTTGTG